MNSLIAFILFVLILSFILYQYKYPVSKILWIILGLFIVYTLIAMAGFYGMLKGAQYAKK
jgi:hypothetical protein